MANLIEIDNVSKNYGSTEILSSINLKIEKQKSLGIFGPSGCGKTTLLQLIGCLDTPTAGIIKIKDQVVKEADLLEHRRKTFGFIFQNFQLLKSESALNNVLLPSLISCSYSKKKLFEKKAKELLELVGLKDKVHQDVNTLSGGEKQRVAIARSLIRSPDCILADEPTGNLDEETKQIIFSLLLDIVQKHNKTLIMVTHDLSFLKYFDETYTLKHKSLNQIPL